MSISHCRTRRRLVALAATATLAGLASPGLMAQGVFPSKAITMVVPYPPGGSNDVFARQVAKEMGDLLKQTVIVDNRPGASGNTGTASVAKAAADGYTLVAVSSSMTTNAAVQAKMPFDPVKDLAPVAMFAKGPLVVAVNNEFPARTPQDLVRAIKASPGQFNYATSGTGSINHFATEMMRSMVPGMDIMHVPYKGQGPAVTDVIGNQVQMLVSSGPSILPMVRNGKLRAIGITSLKPSPIAPDAHGNGHPGLRVRSVVGAAGACGHARRHRGPPQPGREPGAGQADHPGQLPARRRHCQPRDAAAVRTGDPQRRGALEAARQGPQYPGRLNPAFGGRRPRPSRFPIRRNE